MTKLEVNKSTITVTERDVYTSGAAKTFRCSFVFSDDWSGFDRRAIFKADGEKYVVLLPDSGQCRIPWEVLECADCELLVGVYGTRADGSVLPTVWAQLGRVNPGAMPDGAENSHEPTADELAQIMDKIGTGGGSGSCPEDLVPWDGNETFVTGNTKYLNAQGVVDMDKLLTDYPVYMDCGEGLMFFKITDHVMEEADFADGGVFTLMIQGQTLEQEFTAADAVPQAFGNDVVLFLGAMFAAGKDNTTFTSDGITGTFPEAGTYLRYDFFTDFSYTAVTIYGYRGFGRALNRKYLPQGIGYVNSCVENTVFSGVTSLSGGDAPLELMAAGREYTAVINGASVTAAAKLYRPGSGIMVNYVGNLALAQEGSPDTGEDYVFFTVEVGNDIQFGCYTRADGVVTGENQVTVTYMDEDIHQIPAKFLENSQPLNLYSDLSGNVFYLCADAALTERVSANALSSAIASGRTVLINCFDGGNMFTAFPLCAGADASGGWAVQCMLDGQVLNFHTAEYTGA